MHVASLRELKFLAIMLPLPLNSVHIKRGNSQPTSILMSTMAVGMVDKMRFMLY